MTSARRQTASPRGGLEADTSRILDATSGEAPADPSDAATLILTIGLPGSGKSTFCRRLAPRIDAVVLESDALRLLLFGEPTYSRVENRRLFAALHAAAAELLRRGRNVIIDATSLKESDRRPAYALAEQTGARLLHLRFSAPEHIIEQRLSQRLDAPDPDDSSSAGLRVYRRMAATAQAPNREYWDVDTSEAAETEAAMQRVVEACRPRTGRVLGGIR
jgi:hypothetical protein